MTAAADAASAEPAPRPLRGRIDYLDGWRAVAVAIVIGSHLYMRIGGHSSDPGIGKLGVYVFFVLSGYIIARLAFEERDRTGRIDWAAFSIRRALRILPPLVLFTFGALALEGFSAAAFAQAARALAFTCNIDVPPGCGWSFGHTWTLAFEEQFYLLFPAIFAVAWPRAALTLPALAFAALPAWWPLPWVGLAGFSQTYALFALGILAARYDSRLDIGRMPATLTTAAAVAILVAGIVLPAWRAHPLYLVAQPILVAGVVLVTPRCCTPLRRLLEMAMLRHIGLWSYTLYLWQQLATAPRAGWSAWDYGLAVAGATGLAALSYHSYERPFRALTRRYRRTDRSRIL